MVLQGAHGSDDYGGIRLEPSLATFDVEELLAAELGAEARLRHDVVGELERHPRGEEGVAAVGDVGEGAAMDERRRVFDGLHKVRLNRVTKEDDHRRVSLDLGAGDGLSLEGVADDYPL